MNLARPDGYLKQHYEDTSSSDSGMLVSSRQGTQIGIDPSRASSVSASRVSTNATPVRVSSCVVDITVLGLAQVEDHLDDGSGKAGESIRSI